MRVFKAKAYLISTCECEITFNKVINHAFGGHWEWKAQITKADNISNVELKEYNDIIKYFRLVDDTGISETMDTVATEFADFAKESDIHCNIYDIDVK